MPRKPRQILVTSALPYANGPLHIGHLVEYIQTDIWVRFQRLRGNQCIYVCADDAHGTPVMLRADAEGVTPETLIERMHAEHKQDFADFHISFDNFYTTHSDENRECAEDIYRQLKERGHIARRVIRQAYDPVREMFLPDRFIRGECPNCGSPDQYGDSCEVCGAAYAPTDLRNPVSALSGATPVEKESEHLFFRLGDFEGMLAGWTGGGRLQQEVVHKLQEWFDAGLQDWDISRDPPYFGFAIPGEENKFFYVWLDAPIGYMASFLNLCRQRPELDFDAWWREPTETELYHFIGKDIVYFHTLFWPAMLAGAGYRTPTSVFAHGFLTVEGQKMSKSRGTFVMARTYLDHLEPEYLRYYFAAKLTSRVEDLDLSLDDFVQRVNSDLVGKLVNIASRCAGFISKRFDGMLAASLEDEAMYRRFAGAAGDIATCYEKREYSRAMRDIMALADQANHYINERQPWVLAKRDGASEELQRVCTQGLNLFRVLMTYLAPVLPATASRAGSFLNVELDAPGALEALSSPLLARRVEPFRHLLARVDPDRVQRMIEDSRDSGSGRAGAAAGEAAANHRETIPIEDFERVELRVARVVSARRVEGADRLLEVEVDLGGERRTVFAGIRAAYDPKQLEGRLVVVVANLAPRKMRFGVSQGMILAAGPGGGDIFLLGVDDGAEPGMRVR